VRAPAICLRGGELAVALARSPALAELSPEDHLRRADCRAHCRDAPWRDAAGERDDRGRRAGRPDVLLCRRHAVAVSAPWNTSSKRWLTLAAAVLLLDVALTFENLWPTPAIWWRGRLSIELACW